MRGLSGRWAELRPSLFLLLLALGLRSRFAGVLVNKRSLLVLSLCAAALAPAVFLASEQGAWGAGPCAASVEESRRHMDRGLDFFDHKRFAEAAAEFEWARKLMPGHPDPRVNLALCMEQAGRVDDALESYEAALQVWPEYLPAVQGIARATVRARREDPRMAQVVELRCFVGLEVSEVAAVLELDERTIYRDWAFARAWLRARCAPGLAHGA